MRSRLDSFWKLNEVESGGSGINDGLKTPHCHSERAQRVKNLSLSQLRSQSMLEIPRRYTARNDTAEGF